jgi:hypothetical protein
MRKLSRLAATAAVAALTFFPAGAVLAQGTSNTGAGTAATSTTTAPETAAADKDKDKAAPKKKKPAKMTRQQEIDRSVDRGTVPARYRSQVPKEYQQYIPFDKR